MICLFSMNTITISERFRSLAFTDHEEQGELMVGSLYQMGALTVIKA